MRREAFSSVCGFALLIWGCPKRQTTVRVVYVPTPPPAAAPAPAEASETLVIEEPVPLEPAEVSPAETPAPKPAPRRRVLHPEPPESALEPVEPPAEVPPLEPRESPEQQAALRHQIGRLQERLKQRVAQLNRLKLANSARRTLDDARTFLAQSEQALKNDDLQRALNLANKASLLVSALGPGN